MALSYKKSFPSKDYDYIIIGSGISGTGLAAILAKEGKRVLVLERHYAPGGFTHTFSRRGYEWDVGVHYVGQVHQERSFIRRIFKYVTDGSLQWVEMPDIYDRIIFGEKSYDFYKGKKAFKEHLKGQFPDAEDQKAIDEYVELITKVSKTSRGLFTLKAMPKVVTALAGSYIAREAKPFYSKTTWEVLSAFIKNPKLLGVLTGQYGDYGLPPKQSSFIMHAMLANHYFDGGSYPAGGSAKIFQSIEPVISETGGDVYINAEVDEILIKNGKAIGVRMADGRQIHASRIISSTGIFNTYDKLLKKRWNIHKKMKNVTSSVSHLCLYVGLKDTPENLGLEPTNLWVYPDNYDHDENVKNYLKDPENAGFPVAYISFPAAKDPEFQQRHPGRSTIEIITMTDYDIFRKWEATRWHKRGEEYESMKDHYAQRLLKVLYRQLPHLEGKVDYYELSTPLTTRHFMNYSKGEIYGLNHTPERFASKAIHVKTPLKHLYLTGQDLVSCGIAGALISAVVTSTVLTGGNMIKKIASAG